MPLEGGVVRQRIRVIFLDRTMPILDVSFRTGHQMGFIPHGEAEDYLVNPATQLNQAHFCGISEDIDDVLLPGTNLHRQAKQFFTTGDAHGGITEGFVLWPTELPEEPEPEDIASAYADCDTYIERNLGFGWPYLSVTNLMDYDVPVLNNATFLAEAADYVGAQERILFARVPRPNPTGKTLDQILHEMASNCKTMAQAINSRRIVLLCHDGDDRNLDGVGDSEAFLDAAAAGFIASIPVSGWEILAKNPEGLPLARFNDTQRRLLENGESGTPGGITSTIAFGVPAFSTNKTTSGHYIDVTQVRDYLAFKTRQALWLRLRNYNKIPYSPRGFRILYDAIEEIMLANAEDPITLIGIVRRNEKGEPEYNIRMPDIRRIPLAERVNRHVTPIDVDFKYTGSVQKITVRYVMEV